MFGTHMKALLWKDFRQQRGFLLGAVVLLLVPHVVATVALIINQMGKYAVDEWVRFYTASAAADQVLAFALVAFFAGNSIAGERADRSAEFSAYLPIGRWAAVTSKALTALGLSVLVFGTCTLITYITVVIDQGQPGMPEWHEVSMFAEMLALMFGAAWLVSSFARSATYAAACGLGFAIGIGIVLALIGDTETAREHPEVMNSTHFAVCLIIGLGGFIAGAVHYLRRVEP